MQERTVFVLSFCIDSSSLFARAYGEGVGSREKRGAGHKVFVAIRFAVLVEIAVLEVGVKFLAFVVALIPSIVVVSIKLRLVVSRSAFQVEKSFTKCQSDRNAAQPTA